MDQPTPNDLEADHLRHHTLERIAHVAMRIGTTLAQSGASVRVVHEGARLVTSGLGAEVLGMRSGYASFEITVAMGPLTTTRMMQIGPHGVNHRLDFAVRDLVVRASKGGMTPDSIEAELERLKRDTPRHPPWLVAIATGAACAAFGRLLGSDWPSFLPTLAAAGIGQGRILPARTGHRNGELDAAVPNLPCPEGSHA